MAATENKTAPLSRLSLVQVPYWESRRAECERLHERALAAANRTAAAERRARRLGWLFMVLLACAIVAWAIMGW